MNPCTGGDPLWQASGGLKQVSRYHVLRKLDRGGMGHVYLGYDPFTSRRVALKIAEESRFSGSGVGRIYQDLFINELRAASLLHHPFIAEVYDAGFTDGVYYIAMEYVDGKGSLEVFCDGGRLLAPQRVVELAYQCTQALDYAHRKGIIHRDIKPGNILLDPQGKVKLVDFGAAQLTDPSIADTQPMSTVGSPLYMSPEQLRGRPVNAQTDLFSLGAVMYELLVGRHPFAASDLAELTYRVIHEPVPPFDGPNSDVPTELHRIILKAMAKPLTERYANARELMADLGAAFQELSDPLQGVKTENRVEILKGLSFFQGFREVDLWELLRWAQWLESEDGKVIIREGETGGDFHIITSGRVRVQKDGRDVAQLREGDCFGEIGYLSHHRRTATVIAQGPVSTLRMNADIVSRASESCQVQFQKGFIGTLIDRLIQTTEKLTRPDGGA